MGRKRGEIYEMLTRLLALRDRYRGFKVHVIDRAVSTGLRQVPVELIERVTKGYMVLGDGTIIPLHRIVKITDPEGREYWSRFRKTSEQHRGEI